MNQRTTPHGPPRVAPGSGRSAHTATARPRSTRRLRWAPAVTVVVTVAALWRKRRR